MNAIHVIYPYKHAGLWVFDDERTGLDKEPFIAGADTLIDLALARRGIPDADRGFRAIFGASEFPEHETRLTWVREGDGGNWYRSDDFDMEGWLCPALLKYFESAPKEIFIRFEPRTD